MIISRKKYEEEINKRVWEVRQREELSNRFIDIDNRFFKIEEQIHNLRMTVDENYKKQNTPVCGDVPAHTVRF